MIRSKFAEWSLERLINRFIDIGVEQDKALLFQDVKRFNRLYDEKQRVLDTIETRDGDRRDSLLPLYDHPNFQVRLNAANATLAIAPEAARSALQAIRDSQEQPQAGDAGMALRMLAKGVFKPT